jgi:hypothetical protein
MAWQIAAGSMVRNSVVLGACPYASRLVYWLGAPGHRHANLGAGFGAKASTPASGIGPLGIGAAVRQRAGIHGRRGAHRGVHEHTRVPWRSK